MMGIELANKEVDELRDNLPVDGMPVRGHYVSLMETLFQLYS